ncbi:MAG: immunoglobulin-like domain-containing protein [Clostridia bacterium]
MKKKWLLITIIISVILCMVGILIIENKKEKTQKNVINEYISNEMDMQSNDVNTPTENKDMNRNDKNVTIEILNETITREVVEILITDKNENPFYWGESFKVQKKINGVWEELQYISNDFIFNEILHKVDTNNQIKMKINYGKYYGALENGSYRIVKTVYNNEEIDLYSNEFEIK